MREPFPAFPVSVFGPVQEREQSKVRRGGSLLTPAPYGLLLIGDKWVADIARLPVKCWLWPWEDHAPPSSTSPGVVCFGDSRAFLQSQEVGIFGGRIEKEGDSWGARIVTNSDSWVHRERATGGEGDD